MISGNGRHIAFFSDTRPVSPSFSPPYVVIVYDLDLRIVCRAHRSPSGDAPDFWLDTGQRLGLTDDGRAVLFGSLASNLIAGDTNANRDYFTHDCATGQSARLVPSRG